MGGGREHKGVLQDLIALTGLDAGYGARPNYAALASHGYARNAIAFRCVRLVAEAAAATPFQVRRAGQLAPSDDPALHILRQPNLDQSFAELFETFYGRLQVAGDAFLHVTDVEGEVRELYALRPDRMRVAKDKRGWPVGWDYCVEDKPQRFTRDPLTGRSKILHVKVFNPCCDHYGLAPMEAAHAAVENHNAASAWNRALLENAARPSGALVYRGAGGDRMTDDQFERLKSELLEAHSGAKAAGRPLLLEGGLEWRPFSLSPAEMDFVEAKNTAAREIALAFGVPPMLLAIPGDNTYSNYKEANLAFWRLTILPLARKTARAMERWLRPWLGDDLEISCDLHELPALSEERGALWRSLGEASFMTDVERRRLAGLPSRPMTEDGL